MLKIFTVIPGNKCELACSHCANSSGPKYNNVLSEKEINSIINTLNDNKFPMLIFTGGEPTLYIETINKILKGLSYSPYVSITTNGTFALREGSKKLDQIQRLDHIQLSCDELHDNVDDKLIAELKKYSKANGIEFSISYCLQKPTDIINAHLIQKTHDVKLTFERVTGAGRAKVTNSSFQFPVFDETVLEKKCPNFDSITFICDKGYSQCCSNLNFNHSSNYTFKSELDELLSSDFYRLTSSLSFSELAKKFNVSTDNLPPEMSLECNLCEYILTKGLKEHFDGT